MAGFKSRLFGGFDRKSVIEYIEKLAAERNALAEENGRLEDAIDALRSEKAEPGLPADMADGHSEAITSAEEILRELEKKYNVICADIEVNSAHLKCETNATTEKLKELSGALRSAGEKISKLREELHTGGNDE